MTDFIITKIRLAHCKRGPSICELCREFDEGRFCLLDVDPEDRGLMQRRAIEVKRGPTSEWREFDVVKIFDDQEQAERYAEAESIDIVAPGPAGEDGSKEAGQR